MNNDFKQLGTSLADLNAANQEMHGSQLEAGPTLGDEKWAVRVEKSGKEFGYRGTEFIEAPDAKTAKDHFVNKGFKVLWVKKESEWLGKK